VLLQYLCDRAAGYPVIEVSQSTLYTGISLTGIFFGHSDDQLPDFLHHTGPTNTLLWIRPFGGDELSVPREDGVRRYNGGNLP
jgi:hypothetical protein